MAPPTPVFRRLQRDLVAVVRRTAVPQVHAELVRHAGVDIELVQAQALSRIVDGGPMRLSELADQMLVACSTAGRHAAHLAERGLCRRRTDLDDGRVVVVEATDAGRQLLDRLRDAHAGLLAERLAAWDEDDVVRLGELLHRLQHDLGAPDRSSAATEGATA